MSGVPPAVDAARKLRRALSLPEVLLWQELRKRPSGLKFRRQHALGGYVLDFHCASVRLAVEIDGRSHDAPDRARRDVERDVWLASRGVRCLRIAAACVLDDPAAIADWLVAEASAISVASPLHHRKRDGRPPRKGGEDQGLSPCR